MIQKSICFIGRMILSLRYKINLTGLDEVLNKGNKGILLLSNHPALIDPIILICFLYPHFKCRIIGDKEQLSRQGIKQFSKLFKVIKLYRTVHHGISSISRIKKALYVCGRFMNRGDNILLYPSGHIIKNKIEIIGANSGVESILKETENPRIVLIKIKGLWGSKFSRASGKYPSARKILKESLQVLIYNFIFFIPKREIEIELFEPDNFPNHESRFIINGYIENYFNTNPTPNTYVPYYYFNKSNQTILPEPIIKKPALDISKISDSIKELVFSKLIDLSGKNNINLSDKLSNDLGLDSLSRLDISLWIEKEFGFIVENPEALETVAEVIATANGDPILNEVKVLEDINYKWFISLENDKNISLPSGNNIAEIFLNQASLNPSQVIIADQISGLKTYRDIITGINVLSPVIKKIDGEFVGIMMPASVGAVIIYFAVMFVGKKPVMVNWTIGERSVKYITKLLGVKNILTSEKLILKLYNQNIEFNHIKDKFIFLEDLRKKINLFSKLSGKIKSYISFSNLYKEKIAEEAAILFTSGSESFPKAVPLTHKNILANINDITNTQILFSSDSMIGFLPPFHSFGLTVTMIMPILCGIKTVYHSNPTESGTISKLINNYKPTILIGTPTFLKGIVRAGDKEELQSLRLAVTGAEKCPDNVYKSINKECPNLVILEGYGITECSPVVSVNLPDSVAWGSIGKILGSLDYIILNTETGTKVNQGETGMLYVSGDSVFNGYLNYNGPSPFVNIENKTYYKTGDIVLENENGILFFKGRLKRFIKVGGEMISMPAIEEILSKHYQTNKGPVLAVETINDENPEITLFSTIDITRNEANKIIREAGLSPLHNIRKVIRIDEIPVLGTGKTDYKKLKTL